MLMSGAERIPSRETSDLQRKIDEVARLERLEEEGIHTHGLIRQEDPTIGKVIFLRAVRRLHRGIQRRLAPKPH